MTSNAVSQNFALDIVTSDGAEGAIYRVEGDQGGTSIDCWEMDRPDT